jgi:type III pantothenate kinase
VILIYIIPIFEKYILFMDFIIDIGNTRVKYASFQKGSLQAKGYCVDNELAKVLNSFEGSINRLMLSSVKPLPKEVLGTIEKTGLHCTFLSSDLQMPFQNNYETPQSIGADRLALAAGGQKTFPNQAVLVVDIGTCMTFDFIDAEAVYHGGAISPGLLMRLKALNAFTGELPLIDLNPPKDLIGRNTKESILSGVVNGMLKELDGIIDEYKMRYPGVKIILTGGDVAFFDKKLKNSIFADAEILLKGMHFILEQHADKKI